MKTIRDLHQVKEIDNEILLLKKKQVEIFKPDVVFTNSRELDRLFNLGRAFYGKHLFGSVEGYSSLFVMAIIMMYSPKTMLFKPVVRGVRDYVMSIYKLKTATSAYTRIHDCKSRYMYNSTTREKADLLRSYLMELLGH